jgi:hypothetical protein
METTGTKPLAALCQAEAEAVVLPAFEVDRLDACARGGWSVVVRRSGSPGVGR